MLVRKSTSLETKKEKEVIIFIFLNRLQLTILNNQIYKFTLKKKRTSLGLSIVTPQISAK